jgi:2-keto-4-pentenoate hydratase
MTVLLWQCAIVQNHFPALAATAQDIAGHVVKRRRARRRFEPVRDAVGGNLPLAYDVQDLVNRELGSDNSKPAHAAGYKIGLTTPRMQAMCGIGEPIAGVVYAGRLHASGSMVDIAPFIRLGIESEIAVQIGSALPDSAKLDAESVVARLAQVCAAFELVDDADADYAKLDAPSLISDNAWNAGLVLGPPLPARDFPHLRDRAGVLYRNGELLDRGNSSDVMGDPLNVVVWLVKHLHTRGVQLRPGQWISTGSIVTTKFVKPGERYRFEVEGMPAVELVAA